MITERFPIMILPTLFHAIFETWKMLTDIKHWLESGFVEIAVT